MIVGLSSNVIAGGPVDGIGVYTSALDRELRKLGVDVRHVGTPRLSGMNMKAPGNPDLAFRLPLAASIGLTAASGLATPFARNVERMIDVYHATDYRVPRLRRTPVVATIYDAIPLAHPEWANARLRRLKNTMLRAAARNADVVIAISRAAVPELVQHYRVSEDRIRVVHLGVDDDWFEEPPPRAREAARALSLRPRYLLCVGTLQPRKNVAALLRAYDELPAAVRDEHQLVIVGKYGWGSTKLREDLARRAVEGRVRWLQYVERDVLRALYRDARAFVFPSLAEGFGLPVLEALASGLPVVAADIAAIREIAGPYVELVDGRRATSIAEGIQATLDGSRSDRTSEQRRAFARQYKWSTCAMRSVDVYREVMRDARIP